MGFIPRNRFRKKEMCRVATLQPSSKHTSKSLEPIRKVSSFQSPVSKAVQIKFAIKLQTAIARWQDRTPKMERRISFGYVIQKCFVAGKPSAAFQLKIQTVVLDFEQHDIDPLGNVSIAPKLFNDFVGAPRDPLIGTANQGCSKLCHSLGGCHTCAILAL